MSARRVRRWIVALALAPIAVVLAASILIDTDRGRDLLRRRISDALNESTLDGHLEIGSIDGSLYSDVRFRGVVLRDRAGRDAVAFDELRIAFDLRRLASRTLRIDAIELRNPSVLAAVGEDGSLNLAALVKTSSAPPPSEPSSSPLPIAIEVGRLAITGGRFRYEAPGQTARRLEGLRLAASATIAKETISVSLSDLSISSTAPALEVKARADAVLAAGKVTARAVLDASEARIALEADPFVLETRTGSASVRLDVPPAFIERLGLPKPLAQEIHLAARLSEGSSDAPWNIALTGAVADAPISLEAQAGPKSGAARLALAQIDPHHLDPRAPLGKLALDLDAEFPSWRRGRAKLRASGGLDVSGDRIALDPLEIDLGLDGARATLSSRLAVRAEAAGEGRLSSRVDAEVELGPTPSVASLRFDLEARDLDRIVPHLAPVRGRVQLSGHAEGPVDRLAIHAEGRGERLGFQSIALAALELAADVTEVPAMPAGDVELHLGGLRVAGIALDRAVLKTRLSVAEGAQRSTAVLSAEGRGFLRAIDLEARESARGGELEVVLERLSVKTASATWTADRVARFERSAGGRLRLRDLRIGSRSGRIEADADLHPLEIVDEPGRARVRIADLDLSSLAPLAPALGLAGRIDAGADLSSDGRGLEGDVTAKASAIRRLQAGPIDATLELGLHRGQLKARAAVRGPTIGAVEVEAVGRPPRDPTQPSAWRKESKLDRFHTRIDRVRIEGLLALTTTATARLASGIADGRIDVEDDAKTAKLALALEDLRVAALPAPLWVRIEGGAAESIDLGIRAGVSRDPLASIDVHTGIGARGLLDSRLAALDRAGIEAKAELRGLPGPLLATTSTAPRPTIEGEIALSLKERRAHLGAALLAARRGRIELDADASTPSFGDLDAWGRIDPDAMEAMRWVISGLRIEDVAKIAALRGFPTGTLEVDGELGRGLEEGRVRARISGLEIDPALARLDIAADTRIAPLEIASTASISAAGAPPIVARVELSAEARSILRNPRALSEAPVNASLEARGVPLERLVLADWTRAMSGTLRLDGHVAGKLPRPDAQVDLAIENARIVDAVFDDFRAKVRSRRGAIEAEVAIVQKQGGSIGARLKQSGGVVDAEIDARRFDLAFAGDLARMLARSTVGFDGAIEGRVRAKGALEAPEIEGALALDRVRVVLPGAIPPIERTRVDLEFGPSRRGGAEAKLGVKGELGHGKFGADFGAEIASAASFSASGRLWTNGVRVTAGTRVVGIDTEIGVRAQRDASKTSATVDIERMLVKLPNESSRKIRAVEEMDDLVFVDSVDASPALRKREAPRSGPPIDVVVRTKEPIKVRSTEVDAWIAVDVAYRTAKGRPGVFGEVNIEQGRLKIIGRDYEVQEGLVHFGGEFPPDPRLDLRLASDLDALTLYILISGPAHAPRLRFASEPAGIYDQAQLLSFVLGARPDDPQGGSASGKAGSAAAGLLAGQLKDRLGSTLPVDTVEVDTGSSQSAGGGFTLGRWIDDDIFLAYRHRFQPRESENGSEGILRWRFTRRWVLEGSFGNREIGSVDAMWRIRF
jgi:autotransporter translocation and assembly factor TamB